MQEIILEVIESQREKFMQIINRGGQFACLSNTGLPWGQYRITFVLPEMLTEKEAGAND